MSFLQKREKFATSQRQKNRQEIFQKYRFNFAQSDTQNLQPCTINNYHHNNSTNQTQTGHQHNNSCSNTYSFKTQNHSNNSFVFQSQFSLIGENTESLNQSILSNQMKRILEPMPKWIASLGQSNALYNPSTSFLLTKLLSISRFCLQQGYLLIQITNCLVQLTGLPSQILKKLNISEEELSCWLLSMCLILLRQSNNMQLIFNCVYICGNLHEAFLAIYKANMQQMPTPNQITMLIVKKMQQICTLYPGYSSCLQVFIWYIRNFIVLSNSANSKSSKQVKQKNSIEEQTNYQSYFIHILQRIIVTACSKLSSAQQSVFSNKSQSSYYQKIMQSCFQVLCLLMSNVDIYKYSSLRSNLESIDNSINTFISLLPSSPSVLQSYQIKTLVIISEMLSQILLHLSSLNDFMSILPGSIFRICQMSTQGRLKRSESFDLCEAFLEVSTHFGGVNKISHIIVGNLFKNIHEIFGKHQIVADRNFRVSALTLFDSIQQKFSREQIIKIVNQAFTNKKSISMDEQVMNAQRLCLKNQIWDNFQQRMMRDVLPIVFNIIELILIDEDDWNRSMGLRIIYKLTSYWQIRVKSVKNLVVSMGLHIRILEMQEQKEEVVYNAALDLIEELGLDQDECWT